MRSVEDRLVAVLAAQQGSGVLLTPNLILTSRHIFDFSRRLAAEVVIPGGTGPVACEVVWAARSDRCDAALVWAARDLVPDGSLPPLRWGTLTTQQPVGGCQVLGFPQVQRYRGTKLEAAQIPGTLTPLSGRLRGRYVLHSDHHPPGAYSEGSPWAGLSGGPLFAGPLLLGIATEDPQGWEHSAVDAVPIPHILADGLAEVLKHYWPDAPAVEELSSPDPRDLAYEEQYARAVKARYSRMEVFGLDDLGANENSWDLDTAYLSLEAQKTGPETTSGRPERQRIEDLLGSRPRTVLRGEAGAGKTTLVWWLASHAVCRTLPDKLSALDGLIPFVIPMRSLAAQSITAPTLAQLPTIARMPVDEPPPGWAGRILAAGRGLLLVDGMDELPQADRAPARQWLTQFLRMHPGTRCLVTVRPLAVEQSWLESEGFEELQLLPMSDSDIQSFVTAWHKAARLECGIFSDGLRAGQERARLATLERDLSQEFRRNAGLRDLARTPLLCAVICALHRRRSGLLPRTRWHLYQAALAMLLGNRDAYRRVGAPEGIDLTVEDGLQLLQHIAVWLVRNNRTELSHGQAVHQLKSAMNGLRQVREQGTAEQVLTHLLNRSGLLQERAADSIQFIHRTFQDYLAAKEFQDSDSLDELLGHMSEEQWQDVIRLVIGHCGRSEERRVIKALVMVGRAPRAGREERWSVRTLAAQCAMSAASLDDELHAAVWEGLRGLGAPRNAAEVGYLSSLGPEVLEILPGPEGLDEEAARHVVRVLSPLGDAAIPLMARYGQHEAVEVRELVAYGWQDSDTQRYAEDVLAPTRLDDVRLSIATAEELSQLPRLGAVRTLAIEGDHSSDSLRRVFQGREVRQLVITGNDALSNMDFLHDHREIGFLSVSGCPLLRDISALHGSDLRELHLDVSELPPECLAALELPKLSYLGLRSVPDAAGGGRLPPPFSSVTELVISDSDPISLQGIEGWKSLRRLVLLDCLASPEELKHLGGLPQLSSLMLEGPLDGLLELEALPRITELELGLTETFTVEGKILEVFPALRSLYVERVGSGTSVVDFTDVQELPGHGLELFSPAWQKLTVLGADRFSDRLTIGHRDDYD
ncbi:NACHT domain-containing protein [Streptomyces sp. NPDC021096]|uniref:NACHT domain-containing protein n=1 Tax=Streptomyces sp. NPDC021096 TaxID=3154792 RepID=UPI0033D9644E